MDGWVQKIKLSFYQNRILIKLSHTKKFTVQQMNVPKSICVCVRPRTRRSILPSNEHGTGRRHFIALQEEEEDNFGVTDDKLFNVKANM